jgi:Tol biopolymer transport system component
VLLHHLLTGIYPVTGNSVEELRANHALGSRAALKERRPDLPKRICSVVERALAKDPAARYASIQEIAGALAAARAAPIPNAPARLSTWTAAGASAAAAVVLFFWWGAPGPENEASPIERGNWVQLTRFGDSATAPSLSRDGRMVTFIRGSNPFYGAGQIYVKELPDGEPQQVTDDVASKMSPVFSPDGSQIAYTTIDDSTFRWDTRVVSLRGASPPRTLVNASGLTWIGERRLLFSQVKHGIHMALVTAEDGAPSAEDIYVPPHARGMVHRSALSPDGQWVLAAEMENQLWLPCRLLPFDGRDAGRPVGPPRAACMDAAWSPDGAWIYVSSNAGGNFHIWRQRFPDGAPVQLTAGPTDEHGIALTPDGRSLITSVGLTTSMLWITDAHGSRPVSTESNPSLPGLGASAAIPRGTYFSPDRRKLYYLIKQSVGATFLDGELWEADLDTGRTRPMLPGFTVASYDVSSDGKRLVFSAADANHRPRVWLASLDGAMAPRPLSSADDDSPIFGPSGEVFFRRSENGANFLYRMNADGSRVQRIAGPMLAFQSVSPDGKWAVAYSAVKDADVSVAALAHPTTGGAPTRICDQCKVSWSQSGSHLYLSFPWNQGRTYVITVDVERPLPELPAEGLRSPADLAALPVVRVIEGRTIAPGDDGSIYASVRVAVQRNLHRIPVR